MNLRKVWGCRGKGLRGGRTVSTCVSVHVQGCKCRQAAGKMQEQRDPDDQGGRRLVEKSGGGGEVIGSGAWGAGEQRRGAWEGKASAHAGLFSPNVQGLLMKMSTLLGIFQDPDVDLPLPASPTPPSLAQTARAERRRHKERQPCARPERERERAVVSTCSRPRAPCTASRAPPAPHPPVLGTEARAAWRPGLLVRLCGVPVARLGRDPGLWRRARVPCWRSRK